MAGPQLSRRTLLGQAVRTSAGLLAVGAGGTLLAACGDESDTAAGAASPSTGLGTYRLQVSWVPNASWAAEYVAVEDGLFEKAGLDGVELLYGGPQVTVEPKLLSGEAHLGLCVTASFAAAVMNGAPLVAVGADLQRSPFCIVSLPDNPIRTVDDLAGKRIGVQAISEGLWSAFLEIAGVDPNSLTKVPVQADPSLITSGQIDGHLGYVSNTPVALRTQGMDPVVMMLADHGFVMLEQLFVVTRDELENHRDRALAGLKAELAARYVLADDPRRGADLTVDKYATEGEIDPEQAEGNIVETTALRTSATTDDAGLGSLGADEVAGTIATLAVTGLDIDDSAFTTTLLDEIYADGPPVTL